LGVGVGVGLTTAFFCHTSLPLTFLQINAPEVAFTFVHLAPTFATAA
jgi:hypothetical protein